MSKQRKPVPDSVESLLREEVSNRCPLCGDFEKTGEDLTNHHINHDSSLSEYWNLIRICTTCHKEHTKYKTDGVRERRVGLVKRKLFRDHFDPAAVSGMKVAYDKGSVTAMPLLVRELCERGFMVMQQENVFTVGPATNTSTLDVYALTLEGKLVFENNFRPA